MKRHTYNPEMTDQLYRLVGRRLGQEKAWEKALQLLKDGADPNLAGGRSLLHEAECCALCEPDSLSYQTLVLAIEKGAKINALWFQQHSVTPLQVAVWRGSPDIVALYLQSGASPHLADEQGNTPLHYYSAGYHDAGQAAENILQVIRAGGDLMAQNHEDHFTVDTWPLDVHKALMSPRLIEKYPVELLKIRPWGCVFPKDGIRRLWEHEFDAARAQRLCELPREGVLVDYVKGATVPGKECA